MFANVCPNLPDVRGNPTLPYLLNVIPMFGTPS